MNSNLSDLLLRWYDRHGRTLPWRVKGSAHPDPYIILVSEIMLQQTTVKTVIPYFERFIKRFPTIRDLAAAPLEEVYLYWQGLGYYTRARSLHATAQTIVDRFGCVFPQNKSDILKLKGIGEYTVASFLALAFNQPETVIDGNVIRIICRLYHLTEPVEKIMPQIREKAAALTSRDHAADYASAIMDLGAVICTPKAPQCLLCPWKGFCLSQGLKELEQLPNRSKTAKKNKSGYVYIIRNRQGEIFIRKRTEKGLLSGLYEFPWDDEKPLFSEYSPQDTGLGVSHIFTHINLSLKIHTLQTEDVFPGGEFVAPENLCRYPFSTLMKKVYQKFLNKKTN